MITWMQRHKKYLIITIWISTIAFIGAGFVGWGQYKYGDKARSVAKVGKQEISMSEFQKSYSQLYNQYNKMLQGNFDEAKAKQFGLGKQALNQLIQQAYLLNLAADYDLSVSDQEIINKLKTQDYFFKGGVFDKELYKQVLFRNNLTTKEYESGLRKELLIQKVLSLLTIKENNAEKDIFNTLFNIADKINYKVLDAKDIQIDMSQKALKAFWDKNKNSYMSEVSYDVSYIKEPKVSKSFPKAKIQEHYAKNKMHFKDGDGKLLSLENAQDKVVQELNEKATKDAALRSYIAFKKGKLSADIKIQSATLSASDNPFNAEALQKIKKLDLVSAYSKPISIDGQYYIFKLIKVNQPSVKSFEEAKAALLKDYVKSTKNAKLLELANKSLASFSGITSDFITREESDKVKQLDKDEAKEFLAKLFEEQKKRSFITLNNSKVVLYDILEQKLLKNKSNNSDDSIVKLKDSMFNAGLTKTLQNRYPTEIFMQGL